ncbi:hypothetical protein GQ457_05G024980 [Hibiscus cannabinus]
MEASSCACQCSGASSPMQAEGHDDEPHVNLATASGSWFIDSRATHHVSPDPAAIGHGVDYSGPGKLIVGNGVKIPISHVGQSMLLSASRPLQLTQVLHVPNITKNLLSVSKLARDNGVFVEFHAKTCMVREEGTGAVLLEGVEEDGLYRFNACFPVQSSCNKRADAHHKSKTVTSGVSSSISLVPGVEKMWKNRLETMPNIQHEETNLDSPSTISPIQVQGNDQIGSDVELEAATRIDGSHEVSPVPMYEQTIHSPEMQGALIPAIQNDELEEVDEIDLHESQNDTAADMENEGIEAVGVTDALVSIPSHDIQLDITGHGC